MLNRSRQHHHRPCGLSPSTKGKRDMKTLFYFNDVQQLSDFESFEVKPANETTPEDAPQAQNAEYWSVIGTLKAEAAQELKSPLFPVADLPSKRYAELVANLCEEIIKKGGGN